MRNGRWKKRWLNNILYRVYNVKDTFGRGRFCIMLSGLRLTSTQLCLLACTAGELLVAFFAFRMAKSFAKQF